MYIFSCISGRLGFFNVHTTFSRAKTLSLVMRCHCHVTDTSFLDTTTSRDSMRAGFRNTALIESSSHRFVALRTDREGEFPSHTQHHCEWHTWCAHIFFPLYYLLSTRTEAHVMRRCMPLLRFQQNVGDVPSSSTVQAN